MVPILRLVAAALLGILVVAFVVLGLLTPLRYNRYGNRTRKTIRLVFVYLAAAGVTGAVAGLLLGLWTAESTVCASVFWLVTMTCFAVLNLFFTELVEKGPRQTLASFGRFLQRLFTRHKPNR